MSTVQEIRTAIAKLAPQDRVLLTAELFVDSLEPDSIQLEAKLAASLKEAAAGNVRTIDEVRAMLPGWISKS